MVALASRERNKHASVDADSGSNPNQPVKGETRKQMLSHWGGGCRLFPLSRVSLRPTAEVTETFGLIQTNHDAKGTESSMEKREREREQRGCVQTCRTQVVSM